MGRMTKMRRMGRIIEKDEQDEKNEREGWWRMRDNKEKDENEN